jgi:hypothetical protein
LSPSIRRMDCLYFLSSTLVCRYVELNQILNKPSFDFRLIAYGLDR